MSKTSISDITKELDGKALTLIAFLQDTRSHGKITFLVLRDRTGTIQGVVKKESVGEEKFREWSNINRESVVEVNGTVKFGSESRSGKELTISSVKLISNAETPLPLGVIDRVNADLDTRLNSRFIDIRKDKVMKIFMARSYILKYIRDFLIENGFIEIETPKIVSQGAEGGATLFSVDYFGKKTYLAQSPQLYKQMAIAAGLEKVFEIAHAFRAEPSDTIRHLTEFTSLDVEISYIENSEDIMNLLERMVVSTLERLSKYNMNLLQDLNVPMPNFSTPFPRISYDDALTMLADNKENFNEINTEAEKVLGKLIYEKYGTDLFFITNFPVMVKKGTFYAMRLQNHEELTGYFDLEYKGMEITSGGQREHRIERLLIQIEEAGFSHDSFKDYLAAFRYGIPPHGGFGFGIDRFVQQALNMPNVREVVMFPRDRYRITP